MQTNPSALNVSTKDFNVFIRSRVKHNDFTLEKSGNTYSLDILFKSPHDLHRNEGAPGGSGYIAPHRLQGVPGLL